MLTTSRFILASTYLLFMAVVLMKSMSVVATETTDPTPPLATPNEAQRKGYEIAARSDRSDRGFSDSEVDVTMILRTAAGDEAVRQLTFRTLERSSEHMGDKSLIVFRTPKDIAGTALLSHAHMLEPDHQWIFLPALKRVKRIATSNQSAPFVGSEFAFEDFTAMELDKYDYQWQKAEACGKLMCDVLLRTPRYSHSGYSRQFIWIDHTHFQVQKVEFYDLRGERLKTLHLEDYRDYDGLWRSHRLLMKNHQTNKTTDLIYSDYRFKTGLKNDDFIKERLSSLR